jgi:transcriptional regulator with XRE-family HTH domain
LTYPAAVDYKVEIGKRIRTAREALNLSLEELSKRTGGKLSKSRIGNYEQGLRMPGPAEANTLATALGVDAAHLLCLQRVFTDRAIELMRNWSALPEKDREEYFRRIQVLALAYLQPVPDEHLGPGWTAPKPPAAPAGRRTTRKNIK